jgi:hypothetical protein
MSYRQISLLPILSKVYEKLLLHRLLPIIENRSHYQTNSSAFASDILQYTKHRIVLRSLAAFLDISQAFHRVWHTGLLHKLRQFLPLNYYLILKSYLHNRYFQVKVEDSYTNLLPINTGVPQGSVLGPLHYLLYTADLPASPDSTIATYADDTAILATALIQPLPTRNYKPASLLFSIGLPNPPMSPLPLVQQHVPGSTSTMSNFPKQKLSILGYTWTDASPGISTALPKGNILASHSPKCTGCGAISPNFLQATNF